MAPNPDHRSTDDGVFNLTDKRMRKLVSATQFYWNQIDDHVQAIVEILATIDDDDPQGIYLKTKLPEVYSAEMVKAMEPQPDPDPRMLFAVRKNLIDHLVVEIANRVRESTGDRIIPDGNFSDKIHVDFERPEPQPEPPPTVPRSCFFCGTNSGLTGWRKGESLVLIFTCESCFMRFFALQPRALYVPADGSLPCEAITLAGPADMPEKLGVPVIRLSFDSSTSIVVHTDESIVNDRATWWKFNRSEMSDGYSARRSQEMRRLDETDPPVYGDAIFLGENPDDRFPMHIGRKVVSALTEVKPEQTSERKWSKH